MFQDSSPLQIHCNEWTCSGPYFQLTAEEVWALAAFYMEKTHGLSPCSSSSILASGKRTPPTPPPKKLPQG